MNVAILGFGTVGRGAYEMISSSNQHIKVTKILDKKISLEYSALMTTNAEDIFSDLAIDVVVETIGGIEPAHSFIVKALKSKKHVVTANKHLVSVYYDEFVALAEENNVRFYFSAAVGGGIPWVYSLLRTKRVDEITHIQGIVNGTTNYILDGMTHQNLDFDTALQRAQALGYAELDPSSDIDGMDAQRKCLLSIRLAYDRYLPAESLFTFGIRSILAFDIEQFKKMHLTCKLLMYAQKVAGGLCAFVQPMLFSCNHLEHALSDCNNFITLKGKNLGDLSFYGQGAGSLPTGSTVFQDILDIEHSAGQCVPVITEKAHLQNHAVSMRFYLRADKKHREVLSAYIEHLCAEKDFVYGYTSALSLHTMHTLIEKIHDNNCFFAGIAE